MKTAALLLAATLMTVSGAWVQAQSTTNVNQTGNHTNNPNDPGQQSDQSDKLDNKGKVLHDAKLAKPANVRTDKHKRRGKPPSNPENKPHGSTPTSPPAATPAVPGIPIAPVK